MPTRTTATATWDAPVSIIFRCPKCGADAALTRYMRLTGRASVQHYALERAEAAARDRLAADADFQLSQIVKGMRNNMAILRGSKGQMTSRTTPFKCPGCGIISVPDAGCKRRILTPKWFVPFIFAVLFVWLCVMFFIAGKVFQVLSSPLWYLVATLICAALITLASVFVVKRSGSAYDDPALLEKRFRSVLNDAVYADMSPYGLGRIHLGSGE